MSHVQEVDSFLKSHIFKTTQLTSLNVGSLNAGFYKEQKRTLAFSTYSYSFPRYSPRSKKTNVAKQNLYFQLYTEVPRFRRVQLIRLVLPVALVQPVQLRDVKRGQQGPLPHKIHGSCEIRARQDRHGLRRLPGRPVDPLTERQRPVMEDAVKIVRDLEVLRVSELLLSEIALGI